MASFASLPPELLDDIVDLAVPSADIHGWKERSQTLRTLCLTSKLFLAPARRLLYRNVVLFNMDQLRLLVVDPNQPGLLRSPTAFKSVEYASSPSWGRRDLPETTEENFSLRAALLRSRQDLVVIVDAFWGPTLEELKTAYAVELKHNLPLFRPPTLKLSGSFRFLRRLSMLLVLDIPSPSPFTSDHFPNLVSLRPIQLEWRDDPGVDLAARKDDFPLLPQLRALSLVHHNYLEAGSNLAVLDMTIRTPDRRMGIYHLPSTLRILRLLGDSFQPEFQPMLPQVTAILAAADCPLLEEIQLFMQDKHQDEVEMAWIRRWCERAGVKLICRDLNEPRAEWNETWWKFLDDMKGRLKLEM